MARFEDALLERLKHHEPDPGAALPPRRRLTPVVVAAVAVLAALAAVIVPSLGDGASTAQAVTLNSDGTVSVNWKDLDDTEAANRRLGELGVTNVVLIEKSEPGSCAPEDLPGTPIPHPDGLTLDIGDGHGNRTIVRLDRIPPNYTVVLSGKQRVYESGARNLHSGHGVYPTQERYCIEERIRPPRRR